MTDLVLLRDLIRDAAARGHIGNVDIFCLRLSFERLFEFPITRAGCPYPPVAIALFLDLLGVKSINTRARASPDLLRFSRWYAHRLNVLLHFDLSPRRYKPFASAMGRGFALSTRNQTTVSNPEWTSATDLVTRP